MSNKQIRERKRLLESKIRHKINVNSRVTIAKMINDDFNSGKLKVYRSCGCVEHVRHWMYKDVISEKYTSVSVKQLRKCYAAFPKKASGNAVGLCFGTRTSALLINGGVITKANDYDNFMHSLGTGSSKDTYSTIEQRYNYKSLNNGKSTYRLWRDDKANPLMLYGHHLSFLYEHVTCDKSGRSSIAYIWQCATGSNPLLVSLRETVPLLYEMREDTHFGTLPEEIIDLIVDFLLDLYESEVNDW